MSKYLIFENSKFITEKQKMQNITNKIIKKQTEYILQLENKIVNNNKKIQTVMIFGTCFMILCDYNKEYILEMFNNVISIFTGTYTTILTNICTNIF